MKISWLARMRCIKTSLSPFCGDGVVGQGESCDCGSDWACLLSRACCYPPSNSQPGGCQLRSEQARGHFCGAVEGSFTQAAPPLRSFLYDIRELASATFECCTSSWTSSRAVLFNWNYIYYPPTLDPRLFYVTCNTLHFYFLLNIFLNQFFLKYNTL